jgi:hypothetical protein
MSRPQKMHAPLPFTFKEVLIAIASGSGIGKPSSTAKPIQKVSKARTVRKKSN